MAELAWYHFLLGGILIVASIFIVLFVMLQESRQAGLSGAIAGGSDSFYEKNKGRSKEAKLALKEAKLAAKKGVESNGK